MSGRNYLRNARVTVTQPLPGQFFRHRTSASDITTISDLRMVFSVEKTLEREPNTCTLSIFNLAEGTRLRFQRKPLYVKVEAGYDGQFARLFEGDMRWGESVYLDVDWETKLQLADGHRAHKHARVNKSYAKGATAKRLVEEAARSMGLELPKNAREAEELQRQFANGMTLSGPAFREMTRLLEPLGKSWSIQDGKLQILGKNEARTEGAIEVSEDTGMVGSPQFGAPPEKGRPPILHVQSKLRPELVPGGRIFVRSKVVSGTFRLEKVQHDGDTHGDQWDTTMEALHL